MKNNLEVFKIWAPDKAKWTAWAKPVVFATMRPNFTRLEIPEEVKVDFNKSTMLIIDYEAQASIEHGLAYAKLGYRLVPLYNGVRGPNENSSVIDVEPIEAALYTATEILEELNFQDDAPPAFLLDSRRMEGIRKQRGKFDNRWSVFPQDMPSSTFLLNNGINRVILFSDQIRSDLSHILYRYQKAGIKIYLFDQRLEEVKVKRPDKFRSLFYRVSVIFGLTRNAAGGFGSKIPEVEEYSSGRYYGIG